MPRSVEVDDAVLRLRGIVGHAFGLGESAAWQWHREEVEREVSRLEKRVLGTGQVMSEREFSYELGKIQGMRAALNQPSLDRHRAEIELVKYEALGGDGYGVAGSE